MSLNILQDIIEINELIIFLVLEFGDKQDQIKSTYCNINHTDRYDFKAIVFEESSMEFMRGEILKYYQTELVFEPTTAKVDGIRNQVIGFAVITWPCSPCPLTPSLNEIF